MNRKLFKAAAGAAFALAFMAAGAAAVYAAPGWHEEQSGWHFTFVNNEGKEEEAVGFWKIEGQWYCFGTVGGVDGVMLSDCWTGYAESKFYADQSGALVTGWRQIGSYWYYFGDAAYVTSEQFQGKGTQLKIPGALCQDTVTPDGYRVDSMGRWLNGWIEEDEGWRYYADEPLKNTWVGPYYLNEYGVMVTSTTTPDGFKVGADGVWIPAFDYDINGVYTCKGEAVRYFDSPIALNGPYFEGLPAVIVERISGTELRITMKETDQAEALAVVYKLVPGGFNNAPEHPCFIMSDGSFDSTILWFAGDSLRLRWYVGDISDRYEYIYTEDR